MRLEDTGARWRRWIAAGTMALLCGAAQAVALDGLSRCRLRGLEHDAWCGTLQRPLDPAQPQGRRIELHFAVLPALARHKQPDPVLFFAGGPGQSAIDLAGTLQALYGRLLNRRDLVLIDQRGTGLSAPLACDDGDPGRPLAAALDPAGQAEAMAHCLQALQRLPHGDLRHYTTWIAAQDADAVRARLGAGRIDALGTSYGTRVVLEYQRQFPQRVRRAVIDGVAPPDMVLPASFSTDNQAALEAMFRACEEEAACRREHPALRAQWRRLLDTPSREAWLAHPLTGRPERVRVGRDLLLAMVRLPLYVPALASALPQAIDDAAAGRYETLAALASGLQGRHKSMGIAEGMHFSVVCAEDVPRLDGASDLPGGDFGRGFAELYRRVCAGWPRGPVPADFYRLAPAPSATLVLSGADDPATPPRHGERVARALGRLARHVVVPHAGHGVTGVGCMGDVVYRFVDAETDDEALKVDAACVQAMPRPPAARRIEPPPPGASGAALPPAAAAVEAAR